MTSTEANVSKPFETNVKTPESKTTVQVQAIDTANTRYDHHLIDHDLELEDKNGRRINPKAQQDNE